jgi:RimJ/RimL family protein N-acetyltransferase
MTTLLGRHVRLEPLAKNHAAALWKYTGHDAELWKWVVTKYPIPTSENEMAELVEKMASETTREGFAVIDLQRQEAVGSTSYLDIQPDAETIEIGSTFYGEVARRSAINTETKLLLMTEAFESRGMERVAIKADNLNQRSLVAIARIGATYEGTLRSHVIRRDGTRRDTVYFSVIKSEWPAVKAELERKLSSYN